MSSRKVDAYGLRTRIIRLRVALHLAWVFSLLGAIGSRPASASTVDELALIVEPGVVSIASDGRCSLVEALINADTNTATHADCLPGHGADTIVLALHSTYILTDTLNILDGANGLPPITDSLIIHGNGAHIERSTDATAPVFRILYIALGGSLALYNIEIRNGQEAFGAGAYNCGTLSVFNSTFASNQAVGHDGQAGFGGFGGGGGGAGFGGAIYTQGALVLRNSTISNNLAQGGQGGNGIIDGQSRGGGQGGAGAPLSCSFPAALATIGSGGNGGAYFTGATAGEFGGGGGGGSGGMYEAPSGSGGAGGFGAGDGERGQYCFCPIPLGGRGGGGGGFGGALFVSTNAIVTMTNSTIAENQAIGGSNGGQGYGGGVYNHDGQLTITNSVIATNNVSNTIDSIIAQPDISGQLASLGGNVIGDGTGSSGFDSPSDQFGTTDHAIDPLLGPLADNGGWTATRLLQQGSPAINAAEPTACPATDQRGFTRANACDSGAYEYGGYRKLFSYLPVILGQ